MILDLVSPWLAALEAPQSDLAQAAFRRRHQVLLESLRVARTAALDALPLIRDAALIRPLARRSCDPATQQLFRDAVARAAALGADRCDGVVLLPGDGNAEIGAPIRRPGAVVALFIDQTTADRDLIVALARTIAALTRWGAVDTASTAAQEPGDRWEAARNVPLREWVYTEGLGIHLAAALLADAPSHELFSLNHAAFSRLREREKLLRSLLDADLDERGIGLVLRWLTPAAPPGQRTRGDVVLPPMAGRYLAWRMTADRVARVGLREAIRAPA